MKYLPLVVLLVAACRAPTQPMDLGWYERTCTTAEMKLIPGTHTCIGADSSFINLPFPPPQ